MKPDDGTMTIPESGGATEAGMTDVPVELSRLYNFIRSRQLEGTYPGDRKRGIWPITSNRIRRGWGRVLETDWPYSKSTDSWPLVEPPELDAKAKRHRILSYQRITDSYEAKIVIASRGYFGACFQVTEQWFRAEKGVIEVPQQGVEIVGSHSVMLVGYSDAEKRFKFVNSWGEEWGDRGFGYLPYDYFDLFFLEGWLLEVGQTPPIPAKAGIVKMAWAKPDFLGRIFHAREFYDSDSNERLGWAFAVQEQDWLNVEELFVRPTYRRQGYGTRLLHGLESLSAGTHLPLRFFIPFADCQPQNLVVAEHLLAKGKYFLVRNNLPWSPCMAVPIMNAQEPPFELPAPPALCAPESMHAPEQASVTMLAELMSSQTNGTPPVSEATELLRQPDWQSESDEAFVSAAKATFGRHASLLRRLA